MTIERVTAIHGNKQYYMATQGMSIGKDYCLISAVASDRLVAMQQCARRVFEKAKGAKK
jgi:hypothetical protein